MADLSTKVSQWLVGVPTSAAVIIRAQLLSEPFKLSTLGICSKSPECLLCCAVAAHFRVNKLHSSDWKDTFVYFPVSSWHNFGILVVSVSHMWAWRRRRKNKTLCLSTSIPVWVTSAGAHVHQRLNEGDTRLCWVTMKDALLLSFPALSCLCSWVSQA